MIKKNKWNDSDFNKPLAWDVWGSPNLKELLSQNSKEALNYLNKRGLNNNIIEEFKLGYVPWKNNFYETLLKILKPSKINSFKKIFKIKSKNAKSITTSFIFFPILLICVLVPHP